MTEDEAEAVLLAIAEPFEWEQLTQWSFSGGLPGQIDPDYGVGGTDEAGWWTQFNYDGGTKYGPEYQSADAAKAACERHYATGKWD